MHSNNFNSKDSGPVCQSPFLRMLKLFLGAGYFSYLGFWAHRSPASREWVTRSEQNSPLTRQLVSGTLPRSRVPAVAGGYLEWLGLGSRRQFAAGTTRAMALA